MKLLQKENIDNILLDFDNVFLDCDGVIWGGRGGRNLFTGANEVINKLIDLGKNIYLVTNNSVTTHESFFQKCKSFNINIEKESAICSAYVMAQYLKSINFDKKIYIIGSQGLAEELTACGFNCLGPDRDILKSGDVYDFVKNEKENLDQEVGAVLVGFDGEFNYGKIVKANCYLSRPECLLLANNVDLKYPVIDSKISLPAAGVMVRAIETASGRKATVVGKPSPLMFQVLASKYNLDPKRSLMIGDTIYTDIMFGNTCGMKTLLVLTGVSSVEDVQKISSKKDITKEESLLIPQYFITSLGEMLNLL